MKHCTLCGGKLDSQKRCTLCGLDNTKNDSMYKHMINKNSCEDAPLTHVHENSIPKRTQQYARSSKSNASIPTKKTITYETRQYGEKSMPKKVQPSGKKAVGCATFLGLIPFIFTLIGILGGIFGTIFEDGFGVGVPEPDYSIEEEFTDYDPYEWVIDEMPEEGESYSITLGAGIYEVGYHIPMGIYEIELATDGYGTIEIYDDWNDIFISEFLNYDSSLTGLTDVMLFDGAYVVVYSGIDVSLYSENAQPLSVGGTLNSYMDQSAIYLSGEVVSAKDFEPGAYNIIYKPIEDEYSYVDIIIFTDVMDYQYYISFDSEMGEEVFFNVPLPEGASIYVDENDLEGIEALYMIPSESTSDSNLENFYYAY